MPRLSTYVLMGMLSLIATAQAATMAPTAPEKMSSPADRQKMKACRAKAAGEQVPLEQHAKFLMACMKAK